jgi:hypothetical protein
VRLRRLGPGRYQGVVPGGRLVSGSFVRSLRWARDAGNSRVHQTRCGVPGPVSGRQGLCSRRLNLKASHGRRPPATSRPRTIGPHRPVRP